MTAQGPGQKPRQPRVGDWVLYVLGERDKTLIEWNRVRNSLNGNPVYAGQEYPALVVAVFKNEFKNGQPGVNLRVMLDGEDSPYWVTSKPEEVTGHGLETWHYPLEESTTQ